MDAFLEAAKNLANELLPTLGVIVLVFLMVLLYQIIKFFKELRNNLKDVDKTVDLVNQSLDKAQYPLQTAKNISETVDKVHESGIIAFKQAAEYATSNFYAFKDYMQAKKEEKGEHND